MEKDVQKHLDVDKIIAVLREKYPDKKVDRQWLKDEINTSYQNLINYKMGKLPTILLTFDKLIDLTGLTFKEMVVEKQKK